MTSELFESLLFEEEGTTIDFKKEQYRFVNASDDEKSELLKDILGFANAWRRERAYILVGVQDVRGGKGNVVGIATSDQLDDHALQQFVNSLVNTPVHFQYRAFSYEAKQVGVFVLDDDQQRPVYLKRKYGVLEKETVYVRRGSSTNPQKPATLDEIARMGVGRRAEVAEVLVEFAHGNRDDSIGKRWELECELCSVPKSDDLPLFQRSEPSWMSFRDPMVQYNSEYYRELATYEFLTRLCREVRISVKNVGAAPAINVRVEIVVPMGIGVLPRMRLPYKPARTYSITDHLYRPAAVTRRYPGELEIDENQDRFRIVIDCQDLQPGRRVWSDKFYIGAAPTGEYEINGEVMADNLPAPQQFTLTLAATVTENTIGLQELLRS